MNPIPLPKETYTKDILPFTITNLGYVEFVENFCERLKQLNMFPKFVVVCTDSESFKILEKNKDIYCAYSPSNITKNLTEWKTKDYKEVVFNKFDITREILKTAAEKKVSRVLYIDTDIWIHKNFTQELIKLSKETETEADILMQDGENYVDNPTSPYSVPHSMNQIKNKRACTRLCTGFMVLKPTQSNIEMLDYKKNKKVDWEKFVGNQPYLNEVIKANKIKALPINRELLVNGSVFLPNPNSANSLYVKPKGSWLMHYTYLLGEEKKLKMIENNHWVRPTTHSASQKQTQTKKTDYSDTDVFVRCPDGFSNQLRFALAGSFLVQSNCIRSYTQAWVLNNHNNINYTDYFIPLPKINFSKIKNIKEDDIIKTGSFQSIIEKYSGGKYNWVTALQIASKYMLPKKEVIEMVETYAQKNELSEALGIHARRTCKDALLLEQPHRSLPLTNEEILPLCDLYPKIFLATDNAETQKWFYDRLGSKLTFAKKITKGKEKIDGAYDPKKVIRHTDGIHTIIDILALKCCKTFQGSSESSLSLLLYNWRNSPNDFHVFGRF